MPKVVNLKTGRVRNMTDAAVQSLKKHNMFKDLDIVPDGATPPVVKRGPKPKQVETTIITDNE